MNKFWLSESIVVLVNVRVCKEETRGRLHTQVST
jgi:hypothetical protein